MSNKLLMIIKSSRKYWPSWVVWYSANLHFKKKKKNLKFHDWIFKDFTFHDFHWKRNSKIVKQTVKYNLRWTSTCNIQNNNSKNYAAYGRFICWTFQSSNIIGSTSGIDYTIETDPSTLPMRLWIVHFFPLI